MKNSTHVLVLAVVAATLAGCGSSSHGTMSGSSSIATGTGTGTGGMGGTGTGTGGFGGSGSGPSGTHNAVVATPPATMVSTVVGGKITATITFTSNDSNPITGLALSSGAGFALPAGWTGPQTFGCATVSTGGGCVLTLTYQPTAVSGGSKTLTLSYIYIDNAGAAESTDMMGNPLSVSFSYTATSDDNVGATLAPVGQVTATTNSASQMVTATFTTDDGQPASNLAITSDPASLPAGWAAPSTATCATVSAGTPCTLSWSYTPTAPDSGTVVIAYSFNDDSGTAKTSTFNIPYAATANNNIVGAVSPASPLSVASGTAQPVIITFTTDDTYQATNLNLTYDLTMLPTNWSAGGASAFTCASISTGTGCQLSLTYTPTAAGESGTINLTYGYTDNSGAAKTGTAQIIYAST
jgi:hypothetical protein